jgi:hypothetical protein
MVPMPEWHDHHGLSGGWQADWVCVCICTLYLYDCADDDDSCFSLLVFGGISIV